MVQSNEEATHHDQKINTSGRGRSISVGKHLPKDWSWVRITTEDVSKTEKILRIKKLEIREAK